MAFNHKHQLFNHKHNAYNQIVTTNSDTHEIDPQVDTLNPKATDRGFSDTW